MQQYLLRIEAVNFDYAIYDTHDISTIRGGSFMLLDAFEKLKKQRPEWDIGTSANIGLLKFEAHDDIAANAFKDRLLAEPPLAGLRTLATFTAEVLPFGSGNDFTRGLHKLTAACRWQQYQSPALILPQEIESGEACQFDGVRPAARLVRKGDQDIKVSSAVHTRSQNGKDLRQGFYENLLGAKEFSRRHFGFTDDLEALSSDPKRGNLNGKIAFIHIDGNRFGRTRDQKCTNETLLLSFQSHIQENLRKPALRRLLEFATASGNESFLTEAGEIRLETLLWGGDEMEWVVPAWQALNVLEVFFKATSDADTWQGFKLTHSAGVVFCHHNLPILQVRRYARDLCDLAKTGLPTDVNQINANANRIVFLNLSAFDLIGSDVKEFLKDYNQPAQPDDFVVQDAVSALPVWQNHLLALKKHFPRNKIPALLLALKNQDEQEVNDILSRVEKLMNRDAWEKSVAPAIAQLTENSQKQNRWFLIADLMNYVGEDK